MITAFDLQDIYKTYFEPYGSMRGAMGAVMGGVSYPALNPRAVVKQTVFGNNLSKTGSLGQEIFLPVTLYYNEELKLEIECCTIRVASKKNIVKTAVAERQGTVKEVFNIEDYSFTLKGVLIGNSFPDTQILLLKQLFELQKPTQLRNALAELFINENNRVVIESLDFPATEGKDLRFKPFALTCESDFIDTLELI